MFIEMIISEKDLHSHIDKNSTLKKENDRIKKELSSATELHKKVSFFLDILSQ